MDFGARTTREPGRVAVITTAPGRLEVTPEARAEPAEGEVAVAAIATGLCGSDVHLFYGDHPYTHYPLIQGHETVGRVVKVGGNVDATLSDAARRR